MTTTKSPFQKADGWYIVVAGILHGPWLNQGAALAGFNTELLRAQRAPVPAPTVIQFHDARQLQQALLRAEAAHARYELKLGQRDEDWATWYAGFIQLEQQTVTS